MNTNIKCLRVISIVIMAALVCAVLTGCKESGGGDPHEGEITAFNKTAKVKGDASISSADFATAKDKLEEALNDIKDLSTTERNQFNNMMDRGITITASNAVPTSVGGVLKVGVGYLKSKNKAEIIWDLFDLIDVDAFL